MQPYKPIDCSLHDRYEAAAIRRQRVSLVVYSADGTRELAGIITDVLVSNGAEFLVLDGATKIRLDQIQSFTESTS